MLFFLSFRTNPTIKRGCCVNSCRNGNDLFDNLSKESCALLYGFVHEKYSLRPKYTTNTTTVNAIKSNVPNSTNTV